MKQIFFLLLATFFARELCAQPVTSPSSNPRLLVPRDTLRIPEPLVIPSGHSLPPSILAELRRSQTKRTLIYHDTLRASDLARIHEDDSVERTYTDSALFILDTAVSLSHQEWLDSELVEIPELARFGSHVHFNYPYAIMTESERRTVPFDSTLIRGMNPVTREHLPFFDQSPIPLPLSPSRTTEASVELGGGNVYRPLADAWTALTISPRTSIEGRFNYHAFSDEPLHSFLDLNATFHAALGVDPADVLYHGANLQADLGYVSKGIAILQDSNGSIKNMDHTISMFRAGASLTGDAGDRFHYDANVLDHEWNDNLSSGLSESSQQVHFNFHYDPYISHFRFIGEAEYDRAALTLDTNSFFSGALATQTIQSGHASLLFGHRKNNDIEWYAGVTYMHGNGAGDTSYSFLSPIGRILLPLNARWEIGGSFEPRVQLASQALLSQINPFYSPFATFADTSVQHGFDNRSVVMDHINISAFMNYLLSADDELHFEARFITRDREPIFEAHTLADSQVVFSVEPKDTRRFQFSAAGNFLLFARDVLTGSIEVSSATMTDDDRTVPFEPTMKFSAAYHFNSIADAIHPIIEFRSIGRTGGPTEYQKTLNFLDFETRIEIMKSLSLFIRAENILGGPSDFWAGYAEYPRSILASVRYIW